jgi:hypothetical protein
MPLQTYGISAVCLHILYVRSRINSNNNIRNKVLVPSQELNSKDHSASENPRDITGVRGVV